MSSLWSWPKRWVAAGLIAIAGLGFAQREQAWAQAQAPAPATRPSEDGPPGPAEGVRIVLAPGAASQPSGPWQLIEQMMAAPETRAEKRDELRKVRELAQAVPGEDVTPAQLVKAAELKLLYWLQIDETVALPPGVRPHEEGAWTGIDPRLREATRWLLGGEAQPDFLAACSAPVLLNWLSDRFSRRLAEHYMRLENLTLVSDVYLCLVPGSEPKFEMPEALPKAFSVRMWNQRHRSRTEVSVEGKFVWGVISERREDGWYLTEWTPEKCAGPYRFTIQYERRDRLRLLPAIGPAHLPVTCHMAEYAFPPIGGDLVTNGTMALRFIRLEARTAWSPHGWTASYDGIANTATGERCHRFRASIPDFYVGYLYVSAGREGPYACQLDRARMAGMPKYVLGTLYSRITYADFSTEPIDDACFVPPDISESSE